MTVSIESRDIPQADNLDTVRRVVEEVATGTSTELAALAEETGLAPRQLSYYLHAARALGLLTHTNGEWRTTTEVDGLLGAEAGSEAEASAWRSLIEAMPLVRQCIGSLFEPPPSRNDVTRAIADASGLGIETARRRAETLVRWRGRVLATRQASLFGAVAAAPEPVIEAVAQLELNSAEVEIGEALQAPASAEHTPLVAAGPAESEPAVECTEPRLPQLEASDLAYLREQMARGELILFTGAGFSVDALDLDGRNLPVGDSLARDVWALVFPGDAYDESTLPDLFGTARLKKPRQLRDLIARRLRVDARSVPDYMQLWFDAPWQRIYTLNIDDLEEAAAHRFSLSRVPVPISAVEHKVELVSASVRELPVVHLNGSVTDDLDELTFSAQDYARRLATQEPWYAQLAADLLAHPFVFVGSPLEEPLLWQHMAIRGVKGRGTREHRPRSFVVTPALPRAKEALLGEHHIHWVRATGAEFALLLATMAKEVGEGHAALSFAARKDSDNPENISRVRVLLSGARNAPSLYLRGAEPTWGDVLHGRCALRDADRDLATRVDGLLKATGEAGTQLLLVSGTAGTGKSTGLMRLATRLSGDGHDVAWVGPDTEVSARTLGRFMSAAGAPQILIVDEAERYGSAALPRLLREARQSQLRLLVFAIRDGRLGLLENAALRDVNIEHYTMPPLQDSDIGALLDVLASENRLGKLLALPRNKQEAALREQAGRQLLVAMMQATSDTPFEEKVYEEWHQLDATQQYFYALIALASLYRYPMDRELLLVARGDRKPDDLASIAYLHEKHIVTAERGESGIRARHLLIAEKLVERLQRERDYLVTIFVDITYAAAIRRGQHPARATARFLKRLINHDTLFRMLDAEAAERVYERVEELLKHDHHYWLQRGSLHNQHGDFALAETFLDHAMSLEPDDSIVRTEHAHMCLKKACRNPHAPGAVQLAEETIAELRRQNQVRGARDTFPVHILGAQGLSWSRRAPMSVEDRRTFLRGLKHDLDQACDRFPRKQDIHNLRDDIQRELLSLAVGP